MKVWIIEQGTYSNYRVVAIFSTKENAVLYLSKMNPDEYSIPTIDDRDLDPSIKDINSGQIQYRVNLNLDGSLNRIAPCKHLDELDEIHWNSGHFYCVWAKDESHAVKIASDRVFQYIAEHPTKSSPDPT